jgi:DUF1680 family protein
MPGLTRRALLQLGGAAATHALWPTGAWSADAAGPVFRPADYADVTLLDGPLLEQFRAQHAALLAMDERALIKPFREAAGLRAEGPDLGGWYNADRSFNPPEDMHGYIPGHTYGQYVSSLARAFAITGDQATRDKVSRLVGALGESTSARFYAGYPLPAYTFDKVNIGLIDAHALAQTPGALAVLDGQLQAALPSLPEKALTREEMSARPHPNPAHTWDESYTLPENLYLAWRRGAGERYRLLATRFLHDEPYFLPLARGENVLPGKHAYSHLNALCSAMQAYLGAGDRRHLQAARNGFDFVIAQSYATGGWGPGERFIRPGSGALGESLQSTHESFETPCGAYGHFKLARYLLSVSGESRYGDSMERVLYNTVLGSLPMQADGTSFYYADYNANGSKTYSDLKCPCCSGTLGQITADYGISAYLRHARGPVVNLYVPSSYRWAQGGQPASLRLTTAYPLDSGVTLEVRVARASTFSVFLRIPAWAGAGTRVAVNGRPQTRPEPGSFMELRRSWRDGDRIELEIDRPLDLQAVDAEHPKLLAVVQGPLALFATGDRFLGFTREELRGVRQSAAASGTWEVATRDGRQAFRPYYLVGRETTRLYHAVPA